MFLLNKTSKDTARCQHTVICKHVPKGRGPSLEDWDPWSVVLAVNLANDSCVRLCGKTYDIKVRASVLMPEPGSGHPLLSEVKPETALETW